MPTSKPADTLSDLTRAARNLDDQHAQIASLARQAEFLAGAGYAPALHSLLNELSERLQEHFEDEERLLQTLDFGALEDHRDSHLALGKGLATLLAAASQDSAAETDVQQYISGQLRAHFLAGDADVDLFIKGKLRALAAA